VAAVNAAPELKTINHDEVSEMYGCTRERTASGV
jgi:hypothetical protein